MSYTVGKYRYDATELQTARDCVAASGTVDDYLYFPVDASTSVLITGKIDFSSFAYTDCVVYTFRHITSIQPSENYYTTTKSIGSGVVVNPSNVTIYGSAGHMPQLVDRGGLMLNLLAVFGIALITSYCLIDKIFCRLYK